MQPSSRDDLGKYRRVLTWFLIGTVLAVALVQILLDVSLTGVSFVMPAISMHAALQKFAEDHARLPDEGERAALMRSGMITTTVIALIGLLLIGVGGTFGGLFLAVVFLVCVLVNWASLRSGFWMARRFPAATNRRRG